MDTMNIEEVDQYFLDHASRFCIVELIPIYNRGGTNQEQEMQLPDLSYFFHFLFCIDEEKNDLYAICLDNDQIISEKIEQNITFENLQKLQDDCISKILEDFLDIVSEWVREQGENWNREITTELPKQVFTKAKQPYWDKFHEIRNTQYLRGMTRYLYYLSEEGRKGLRTNIIGKDEKDSNQKTRIVYQNNDKSVIGQVTEESKLSPASS